MPGDNQESEKTVALDNGRVPPELPHLAKQLCGRIPADADKILALHGRVPPAMPNALLAKPAEVAKPITPSGNSISTTEKPVVENSAQQMLFPISRKASH